MAELDKERLDAAFEAYWAADGGTFKGIEAAIVAYLQPEEACDLCRGAGFVTYRDGIPYETHDVEKEEHLIEDCPECKGTGLSHMKVML